MVRFKTVLSRFINRLSLMSNLKLSVSEAKTSKSSKLMMQSHCKWWSETADYFTFLTRFSVKLEIPICLDFRFIFQCPWTEYCKRRKSLSVSSLTCYIRKSLLLIFRIFWTRFNNYIKGCFRMGFLILLRILWNEPLFGCCRKCKVSRKCIKTHLSGNMICRCYVIFISHDMGLYLVILYG